MTARDDTIKVVDQEWRSATDIHQRIGSKMRRVGKWSTSAVRHALICMASEHIIEARATPGNNRKYEYRLRVKP